MTEEGVEMGVASGRRVRIGRVAIGLTQKEFAKRCGLRPWLISVIERGEHPITHDLMRTIGEVLAKETGGRIVDFFPFFIPKDADNTGPGSPPQNLVGNQARTDEP